MKRLKTLLIVLGVTMVVMSSDKTICAGAGGVADVIINENEILTSQDGLWHYSLDPDTNEASIVGIVKCSEGGIDGFSLVERGYMGNETNITVPESIDGHVVRKIGNFAFRGCSDVESITLPSGITEIGMHSFVQCYELKELMIPEGVTTIGPKAFYGCTRLKKITFPQTLETINGYELFVDCRSLERLDFPGVPEITGNTYSYRNDSLKIVIYNEGTKVIDVPPAKWTILPNSVTTINGTTQKSKICVRDLNSQAVQNITEDVYQYVEENKYRGVILSDGTAMIIDYYGENTELQIPETIEGYKVTALADEAFCACYGITSINIPEGVTKIGKMAFYQMNTLETIVLPDSLEEIGEQAFYGCVKLSGEINISEKVTCIEDKTFYDCKALEKCTGLEGVCSIGKYAFYDCSSLTEIALPDTLEELGIGVFIGCELIKEISIPDKVTLLDDYVFCGCEKLEIITLPNTLKIIGPSTFASCKSLKEITFPQELEQIGENAFEYCSSLEKIVIPDKITTLGNSVFFGCYNLKEVTLPDGLVKIGENAFFGCSGLEKINIPEGVKIIGNSAFSSCKSIKEILLPASLEQIGYYVFSNCWNLDKLAVAEGNLIYDSRDNCNAIIETASNKLICGSNKTIIPQGVVEIGEYAFSNITNLQDVVIPDSVTTIGNNSFSHNQYAYGQAATKITIPKSVTSIGEYAFWHNRSYDYYGSNQCECLILYVYKGSYAQQFAKEHGITFVVIEENNPTQEENNTDIQQPDGQQTGGSQVQTQPNTSQKLKTQKITTAKIPTYKVSKLKKKKATLNLKTKASGKGKITYTVSKKAKKYIKVSKKGVVTIKKGTKKGTYKIVITASETTTYKKTTKTVRIVVK